MLEEQQQQQRQQLEQQQQQQQHDQQGLQCKQADHNIQQYAAAAAAHTAAAMPATAAHTSKGELPADNVFELQQLGSGGSCEYEDADADEDEYEDEGEDEHEDGSEDGSQQSLPLMQQAWKPDYTFKVSCWLHALPARLHDVLHEGLAHGARLQALGTFV
jgi:hypothetical protein